MTDIKKQNEIKIQSFIKILRKSEMNRVKFLMLMK